MKKVLFISHEASMTGAPIYLKNLVIGLNKKEIDYEMLVLFASNNGGLKLTEELKQKKINFIISHKRTLKKSIYLKLKHRFIYYLFFVRLIFKFKPDLVYSNTALNFSEVFISKFLNTSVLIHIHEGFNFCKELKWRLKISCFLADKIIVGSKYANKALKQLTGYNGSVVYNGTHVNPTLNRKLSHKHFFTLGVLGTITPNKGQIIAIQALKQLIDSDLKVKLYIAGKIFDKEYNQVLKSYIKVNNLQDFIEFKYEIADSTAFLKSLDVLLVPSFDEVFPTVILEAFAIGSPVIASRVGGIPEIVADNKNSYLFEAGNFISLAKIIQNILNNKSQLKTISKNAVETIKNQFGMNKMIYKINSNIEACLMLKD